MADAISVSAPISGTDRTMSFEAGKLAQLADGAVVARIGDTVLLATATAARSVREGTDFFPLTVDIEERAYAAGKIPGSFFRREGKSSDQAILTCRLIDRPLRPVLPRRIPQRGPRRRDDHRRRPGEPARRAGHQRGVGGADALGHPLRRPHRRRPRRLHHRGRVDPAPDVRGGRGVDLRARRGRPCPHRGRRQRDRHHDGRGRRDREVVVLLRRRRPQGHRGGAGVGPRSGQDVDPRVHQPAAPPGRGLHGGAGPDRDHPVLDLHRLPGRRLGPGGGGRDRPHRQGQPGHEQGRAQRRARRRRRGDPRRPRRRVRRPAGRGQGSHPLAHQEAGAQAHRRGRRARGRPWHRRHPAALGRDRPAPDRARLGAVPARRDPGAQRHDAGHAPHEPAARHDHPGRPQALHAPLQLPALLHRRDRLHARSEAPGDRARPAGRAGAAAGRAAATRSSPTPCVWSPTCWPPTGRPPWPRSAVRRCR